LILGQPQPSGGPSGGLFLKLEEAGFALSGPQTMIGVSQNVKRGEENIMAKTNDRTGLPPEMPKAPGNAKSGQPPPQHVTAAAGPVPPWMSPEKQKWTKDRVNAIDEGLKSRAGRFYVGEPQLKDIPGYQIL
jgi:hypothetical protein